MPDEVILPAGGSILTLTGSSTYLASLPLVRTIRATRPVAIPAGIWNFIDVAAWSVISSLMSFFPSVR